MVNFVTQDGQRYCITFNGDQTIVGRSAMRKIVRCRIYMDDHQLLSEGMSMCHPIDAFDPRKGAHLALKAAAENWFPPADVSAMHKKIDTWFK